MNHFDYELEESFDKKLFAENFKDAKVSIAANNGPVVFELQETSINKKFNSYTGVYEKYRILQEGELLGFLEAFRDNNLEYMNIYTSPIN